MNYFTREILEALVEADLIKDVARAEEVLAKKVKTILVITWEKQDIISVLNSMSDSDHKRIKIAQKLTFQGYTYTMEDEKFVDVGDDFCQDIWYSIDCVSDADYGVTWSAVTEAIEDLLNMNI